MQRSRTSITAVLLFVSSAAFCVELPPSATRQETPALGGKVDLAFIHAKNNGMDSYSHESLPTQEVPPEVVAEVAHRTPGFNGWQQEQWWAHCGDAAQFLGRAGKAELLAFGAGAIAAIRASGEFDHESDWREFLDALDKDGSPTAYLFRCAHCGAFGGYHDFD